MRSICFKNRFLLWLTVAAFLVHIAPAVVEAEDHTWSNTSQSDFEQGELSNLDTWSSPGSVLLDHAWQTETQVNTDAANSRDAPRLAWHYNSSAGRYDFYTVWEDERTQDHYPDIYFNVSLNHGTSWPFERLISMPHVNDIEKKSPDISVRTKDNSLWVAWWQIPAVGSDDEIYFVKSINRGINWSAPARIYTGAGLQKNPRIVSHDSSGMIYCGWEDERDDNGDIYISRIDPDAASVWDTPVQITDDSESKEQETPDLAVDASGNVYAVWHDYRENDDGDIYFSSFSAGSGWSSGSWSANVRLNQRGDVEWAQENPAIAVGTDGSLYVAWAERVSTGPATYDFQVVVARSSDQGNNWSQSVVDRLVHASAGLVEYLHPSIDVDPDGKVYVAWYHQYTTGTGDDYILSSISPDSGSHWTTPRIVSGSSKEVKGDSLTALAVSPDEHLVVAWEDYRDTPDIYTASYPGIGYETSGELIATLDAGQAATWGTISWSSSLPGVSAINLFTRVRRNAASPWSDWTSHTVSGEDLDHPQAEFMQYKAIFSGDGSTSPVLNDVEISYTTFSWPMFVPAFRSR